MDEVISRRIYVDNRTGEIIWHYNVDGGIASTVDQDFEGCYLLQERVRDTVLVIELTSQEYAQDFAESNGVTVDVSGAEPVLNFSYPDPNAPQDPPVYVKPLSEQIAEVKAENSKIKQELAESTNNFVSFTDFYFANNPEQA